MKRDLRKAEEEEKWREKAKNRDQWKQITKVAVLRRGDQCTSLTPTQGNQRKKNISTFTVLGKCLYDWQILKISGQCKVSRHVHGCWRQLPSPEHCSPFLPWSTVDFAIYDIRMWVVDRNMSGAKENEVWNSGRQDMPSSNSSNATHCTCKITNLKYVMFCYHFNVYNLYSVLSENCETTVLLFKCEHGPSIHIDTLHIISKLSADIDMYTTCKWRQITTSIA